jgi:hypothetical protein
MFFFITLASPDDSYVVKKIGYERFHVSERILLFPAQDMAVVAFCSFVVVTYETPAA